MIIYLIHTKLKNKIRETDPNDPYRLKTVQLYDDFKINGPNGTRKKIFIFTYNIKYMN